MQIPQAQPCEQEWPKSSRRRENVNRTWHHPRKTRELSKEREDLDLGPRGNSIEPLHVKPNSCTWRANNTLSLCRNKVRTKSNIQLQCNVTREFMAQHCTCQLCEIARTKHSSGVADFWQSNASCASASSTRREVWLLCCEWLRVLLVQRNSPDSCFGR